MDCAYKGGKYYTRGPLVVSHCAKLGQCVPTIAETSPHKKQVHACEGCLLFSETITEPPILVRGVNFAFAMVRHAMNGLKMCSTEEIESRLSQCQVCKFMVNGVCRHKKCGCNVNDKNSLVNKLALKSESCPIGKW